MKRVLIATPAYDGKLVAWYTTALCTAMVDGPERGVKFTPRFVCYDSLIQRARNDLLAHAIEDDYDGILWIDSDMTWDSNWAIDIVNSGKDVIGLPCPLKNHNEDGYNVWCSPQDLLSTERYMEVTWVGTGFLYMSRDAMQYLWDSAEIYTSPENKKKWVFDTPIRDGSFTGEDVAICHKLREGGFRIFIDPSKTCGHVGVHKFDGDFANFCSQITRLRLNK